MTINDIRKNPGGIIAIGMHQPIFQSILDFDYLCGKKSPSILAIVANNRKAIKLFFGRGEILIPCFPNVSAVPQKIRSDTRWMLNVQSARRALESTKAFFDTFPHALGGHIFAENVPEKHATELIERYGNTKLIAGPSGVGLLVAGQLKVGAIGGTDATQINASGLTEAGSIAVISTSAGMTNELLRSVAAAGKRTSFSISIGGDRFPIISLTDVFALAEADPVTKAVAYFGELGGTDEYEIVELLKSGKFTKPIVAYISGIIDDAFEERIQFGHAKALVSSKDESSRAKRDALNAAGAKAPESFRQFLNALRELPGGDSATMTTMDDLSNRRASILSTREVVDLGEKRTFVSKGKLLKPRPYATAHAVLAALLGRDVSDETAALGEAVLELLIDHGGNVSGAVNTMITARAGKDLMASLAAGILTVGPRFGGAVNAAAALWLEGVASKKPAGLFVEEKTKGGALISGIGHRKYRIGLPDPRVDELAQFATLLKKRSHYEFARTVEEVTTSKNGKLILNVDGVLAALFLDMLSEKEKYSPQELRELVDAEFFNALFVIPRSVGFIAHFMEQKKNDEGLFRLPDELLFITKKKK